MLLWSPRRPPKLKYQALGTSASTTSALPKHPQADIENRNQCYAYGKTRQHKFFAMFEHFSNHSMRGQIKKSAANIRHDQAKPKSRDFRQPQHTDHAADERSCFYGCHPTEGSRAPKSRTDQKTTKRETFRNLVDTESREERPFCRVHWRR